MACWMRQEEFPERTSVKQVRSSGGMEGLGGLNLFFGEADA